MAEGNLKVQMSALRKVLNEDRDVIKTVHGRGYVFTGEVTMASVEPDALVPMPRSKRYRKNLPLGLVRSLRISCRPAVRKSVRSSCRSGFEKRISIDMGCAFTALASIRRSCATRRTRSS